DKEDTVVAETAVGIIFEVVLPRIEPTPTSGLNLLLEADTKEVNQNRSQLNSDASKLLHIQKNVGFRYEEPDDMVGGMVKRRRIRDLVQEQKFDFLALQETKMEDISEKFFQSLFGSVDCSWAFLPSEGSSGGILSIWNKAGFGGGNWCVVGDFNVVREPGERRGVNVESSLNAEMRDFGVFLNDLELVDLPLLGRRFTWYHANGRAMSRIDRILVSSEWLEVWGNCSLWVGPRDVSDHCPLTLKNANNDRGPKPFRFNNNWLVHKNFEKVVEECWLGMEVSGWMGFVLSVKLRGLKTRLKEWNKIEYGSMESRLVKLVEDIKDLDVRGESVGLDNNEVSIRKELFVEYWKLQKHREAIIFQRSRSKWLGQGDANSKFFHGCVLARSKRNVISALKIGDIWLESPSQIREAVEHFFL
ncbi:putative transposon TX1 protein, partial [Trifolium medium]|nr:putative transposon TX1 protein [Trifolium medium]